MKLEEENAKGIFDRYKQFKVVKYLKSFERLCLVSTLQP